MTKKVLVAGNQPEQLINLGFLLDANGYKVVLVEGGIRALHAAKRERPDLILAELSMGLGDGLELAGWVRAEDALAEKPFIILTNGSSADAVRAQAAGADGYLAEDKLVNSLVPMIEQLLTNMQEKGRLASSVAC